MPNHIRFRNSTWTAMKSKSNGSTNFPLRLWICEQQLWALQPFLSDQIDRAQANSILNCPYSNI